MVLVSVIIPAHNAEKTIRETIDSVLHQTISDLELIVINDNSSDSTLDILQTIQDQRLKVFSCVKGNAGASRNVGISHASGEFITFLDADDLWTPDKLEAQLTALQKDPEAAVAYSWVDRIDENGKFLGHGSRIDKTGNIYAELLWRNFLDTGSNPLIRRYALTDIGNFDESLTNAEDWDIYLRLAARYHFTVVPYPHILYRVSRKSKSNNLFGSEASCLKIMKRAYNDAPKALQEHQKQAIAAYYRRLISRTLTNPGRWQRSSIAIRLFWNYLTKAPDRYENLRFKFSLLSMIFKSLLFKQQKPI
jgi:glycosyltransferase involved in cell wall biosynthesis